MKEIYKLGNGNILVVHDTDLEAQAQVWYEELEDEDITEEKMTDFSNYLTAEEMESLKSFIEN